MKWDPEDAGMSPEKRELLHMLKYGRGEEIRAWLEPQIRKTYPNEFIPFMEQMLGDYGISRKDIAVRSGLSQDYVYKLLRGVKRTAERDYLLAMCFAIGMNLPQTQHALSAYGMPLLSENDLRSHIIILALQNGDDIDELDRMLERAGFPLLKTSPDMPSAPIMDTMPAADVSEERKGSRAFSGKRRKFTEIDSFTDARRSEGNGPLDYDYEGWIRVKDENGSVYQIEAVFGVNSSDFLVFTQEQREEAERLMRLRHQREAEFYERHRDVLEASGGYIDFYTHPDLCAEYQRQVEDIPQADMLESYGSLEETAASEFFPFFLEIDKRTDKKVLEVLQKLDDTREYGIRISSSVHGGERPKAYIELFNDEQPELREYFQLVESADGTCRYTASHESCFMRMELGPDFYELWFGRKRAPEFFIDTDKNDFKGSQMRFRFIFDQMKMLLHEQMHKGGFLPADPAKAGREKVECLIEQGVGQHFAGNEPAALDCFREAAGMLEENGGPEPEDLAVYVCTCAKIAMTLEAMRRPEASEWRRKIDSRRDAVLAAADADPEEYTGACSALAETVMMNFRNARQRNNAEQARSCIEKVLDMIENHHAASENWALQFEAYGNHAVLLEEENLEGSLREYRKALAIARDHHLDQDEQCALSVVVLYNNYAWILWNRCGSEEAVISYGRAIDLLESYLSTGVASRDTVMGFMKGFAMDLNQIYLDTSRLSESRRLRERMAENGVELE